METDPPRSIPNDREDPAEATDAAHAHQIVPEGEAAVGSSSSAPAASESAPAGARRPPISAEPEAIGDAGRLAARQVLELHDLLDLVRSKRRLLMLNFWVGLLRGLGFFLGMTIVGAVLLGLLAFLFDWVATRVGLDDLNTRSVVQTLVDKYYEVTEVVDQIKQERHAPREEAGSPAGGSEEEGADREVAPENGSGDRTRAKDREEDGTGREATGDDAGNGSTNGSRDVETDRGRDDQNGP